MVQRTDKRIMYLHPWCNRLFMLKEKWVKLKVASTCCLFLCKIDPLDCTHCHIETELSDKTFQNLIDSWTKIEDTAKT